MTNKPRILVIEDSITLAEVLQGSLQKQGFHADTVLTAEAGIARIAKQDYDAVLTDWKMPGIDGLELISRIRNSHPHLPVIMMTGWGVEETVIDATRLGAFEYLEKPCEVPDLITALNRAVHSKRAHEIAEENEVVEALAETMIGCSRPMLNLYKSIGRVAVTNATVLIRGETGTGKELVARALHEYSDRWKGKLVSLSCAAIPENLLESELFGHKAGAFTGANRSVTGRLQQADGGTLFLDEIGEVGPSVQAKILRIMEDKTVQRLGDTETREVDVRIIAATNLDLETAVAEGRFRADLYYRLNDAVIRVPPLRERTEDIPLLVRAFIRAQAHNRHRGTKITEPAMALLQYQPWPGNVRQLRNVVQKALLRAHGYVIDKETVESALAEVQIIGSVPPDTLKAQVSQALARQPGRDSPKVRAQILDWAERELFKQAYVMARGETTKLVSWLGISKPTLLERLRHLGLKS